MSVGDENVTGDRVRVKVLLGAGTELGTGPGARVWG